MATDPVGLALLRLYGSMARMRRDHPGLRSAHMYPERWEGWQTRFDPVGVGVDVERQLVIYHRWADLPGGGVENFVIVLNFSDSDQSVAVPFPLDGTWTDLLSDPSSPWSAVVRDHALQLTVTSNWGRVLRRD
jgi:hypothetical protein